MQTLQQIFIILIYLDSIENILIFFLLLFLYSLGENKFVYFNKFLPFNRKSINPIQKYPHIIESDAYIPQIFVIFLFPINFIISFGICSTQKLSKTVTFLELTYKAIQLVPIDSHSSIFIIFLCPILYFKYIIPWINTIKFRFILMFLYFKISEKTRQH